MDPQSQQPLPQDLTTDCFNVQSVVFETLDDGKSNFISRLNKKLQTLELQREDIVKKFQEQIDATDNKIDDIKREQNIVSKLTSYNEWVAYIQKATTTTTQITTKTKTVPTTTAPASEDKTTKNINDLEMKFNSRDFLDVPKSKMVTRFAKRRKLSVHNNEVNDVAPYNEENNTSNENITISKNNNNNNDNSDGPPKNNNNNNTLILTNNNNGSIENNSNGISVVRKEPLQNDNNNDGDKSNINITADDAPCAKENTNATSKNTHKKNNKDLQIITHTTDTPSPPPRNDNHQEPEQQQDPQPNTLSPMRKKHIYTQPKQLQIPYAVGTDGLSAGTTKQGNKVIHPNAVGNRVDMMVKLQNLFRKYPHSPLCLYMHKKVESKNNILMYNLTKDRNITQRQESERYYGDVRLYLTDIAIDTTTMGPSFFMYVRAAGTFRTHTIFWPSCGLTKCHDIKKTLDIHMKTNVFDTLKYVEGAEFSVRSKMTGKEVVSYCNLSGAKRTITNTKNAKNGLGMKECVQYMNNVFDKSNVIYDKDGFIIGDDHVVANFLPQYEAFDTLKSLALYNPTTNALTPLEDIFPRACYQGVRSYSQSYVDALENILKGTTVKSLIDKNYFERFDRSISVVDITHSLNKSTCDGRIGEVTSLPKSKCSFMEYRRKILSPQQQPNVENNETNPIQPKTNSYSQKIYKRAAPNDNDDDNDNDDNGNNNNDDNIDNNSSEGEEDDDDKSSWNNIPEAHRKMYKIMRNQVNESSRQDFKKMYWKNKNKNNDNDSDVDFNDSDDDNN